MCHICNRLVDNYLWPLNVCELYLTLKLKVRDVDDLNENWQENLLCNMHMRTKIGSSGSNRLFSGTFHDTQMNVCTCPLSYMNTSFISVGTLFKLYVGIVIQIWTVLTTAYQRWPPDDIKVVCWCFHQVWLVLTAARQRQPPVTTLQRWYGVTLPVTTSLPPVLVVTAEAATRVATLLARAVPAVRDFRNYVTMKGNNDYIWCNWLRMMLFVNDTHDNDV